MRTELSARLNLAVIVPGLASFLSFHPEMDGDKQGDGYDCGEDDCSERGNLGLHVEDQNRNRAHG